MKKFAALLLSFSLFLLPSLLFSCSCEYVIEEFCPTVQTGNHIVLGVITELEATNMEVTILEDIYKETTTETLDVLGQDGLNCGASLNFAVGDTMVFSLYNYSIEDAQSGELYSWFIEGCGNSYLTYSDGHVLGSVDIGVDDMPYDEFLENIEECVGVSYSDYINEFAPIGAEWKIRGKNMDDKRQGYFDTCETSGCGGSYWQYEVNRKEEVLGKSCSMIEIKYGTDYNDLEFVNEHAVYEEASRVYFYDSDLDTFLLMMDYNLEVGEILYSHAPQNLAPYSLVYTGDLSASVFASKVYEINHVWTSNGYPLKSFTFGPVDGNEQAAAYYHVVQGIGHLGALFGDNQIIIDEYECAGSFICYQDGLKKYSIYDEFGDNCPCQFQEELTNVDDLTLAKSISVYPNPTSDVILIESEFPIQSYTIYNLDGRTIQYSDDYITGSTISLDQINEGVYFIELQIGDHFITHKLTKI